jgi:dUTP pyrophosphatase
MNNPVLKFKKTHDAAVLPKANNDKPYFGDTGYDLTAVESAWIPPGTSKVVEVGLTLADITPGYWFRIEPRSGLGFKNSIQPHLGVIDNGYRGDLGVKLYNFHETKDLQVEPGDKIAQIVVYPLIQPECEWSDQVTETDRGDNGFGSSDKLSADMQDIKEKVLRVKSTDDWWSYADAYTKEKLDSGEYIRNPMKMDEGDPDYIKNPDYEQEK